MARTAHHLTHVRAHRDLWTDAPPRAPWHSVVLHGLRYSAATLADAARAGRRPRPQRVRPQVTVRRFARYRWDRSVSRWAAEGERRARQDLRGRLRALELLVDDGTGHLDLSPTEDVDVPPTRHRHTARWLA
ncbi:hypothetical protein [Streptomyces sp. TRM49041]|uniref:hypothetical protein n=1 Tax=Streptomyces sp. TRM49041 TaxID=2603216 RepID=UPI0021CCF3DE|nr:hypothetical protein [Streptomyces sp. TRM49041]